MRILITMRIAVISDIHGNLEALTAVLKRLRKEHADTIVCLGDIVGYGPFPNECIEIVHEQCDIVIRGNHDAGAEDGVPLETFDPDGRIAMEWTRKQLSEIHRKFLLELPLIDTNSHGITYVHASPADPERWARISTWHDAAEMFPHFTNNACCVGHTHIPAVVASNGMVNDYQRGERHVINAGSVGQPRDGDPRASFALLDTKHDAVSIIRVEYSVASTVSATRKAGLPEFLAKRLELGI